MIIIMVLIRFMSGPFLGMSNTSSDESDDGIIEPTEVFTMDDYVGLQNNLNNIVR